MLYQYDITYTPHIFTDLSKIGEAVGAAAIVASRMHNMCLPKNESIFSVENLEEFYWYLIWYISFQEESFCFFLNRVSLKYYEKKKLHRFLTLTL